MALPRLKNRRGFYGGGVIKILDDLSFMFTGEMLHEIHKKNRMGYSTEEIAEYTKRDPDEVILVLIHLARQGEKINSIGFRYNKGF